VNHENPCEYESCPGHDDADPLPSDAETVLATYGSRIDHRLWPTSQPEIVCVVRRSRPSGAVQTRLRLGVAWGLVQHASDQQVVGLTAALNTLEIERYLSSRSTAHQRGSYRAPLMDLLATAQGLPGGRPKRAPSKGLTAEQQRWLVLVQREVPLAESLAAGLTPIQLENIGRTIERSMVAPFRGALRG
jgi:hypothetical protein